MELECKASGSPPPEIFWFTGSGSYEDVNITTTDTVLILYDQEERRDY